MSDTHRENSLLGKKDSHLRLFRNTVFYGLIYLSECIEVYRGMLIDDHFWKKVFLYFFRVDADVLEAFRQVVCGHLLLCTGIEQTVEVYERPRFRVLVF